MLLKPYALHVSKQFISHEYKLLKVMLFTIYILKHKYFAMTTFVLRQRTSAKPVFRHETLHFQIRQALQKGLKATPLEIE
jgi:hypothetical protein